MPIPTSTIEVREKIIARAISQLGVVESPPYSNNTPYTKWYGITGPWCAMFVSWCFYFAGFPLKISTSKGFAYCPAGVDWFKRNGAWASRSVKPKRGWVVFYDFIGRPSHTGIVEGVATDGRIVSLEGNTNASGSRTGGAVMRHYRSTSSIVGYGVINYSGSEEFFDMDEATLRRILQEELNKLDDEGRPLDKQNAWTKSQFATNTNAIKEHISAQLEGAIASIKSHATTIRTSLVNLIRQLPGAPQDE